MASQYVSRLDESEDEDDFIEDEQCLLNRPGRISPDSLSPPDANGTQTTNRDRLDQYERKLKQRLRYYFMTPCQKWKFRGRRPFKLSIQVTKILLVSLQVVIFGMLSMDTADYISSNLETFKTLFLHEDSARASLPDANENDPRLAIAEKSAFYYSINHARQVYTELDSRTFDVFGTDFENNTMQFCIYQYDNTTLHPSNGSYYYDPGQLSEICYEMARFETPYDTIFEDHIPLRPLIKTKENPNRTVIDKVVNFQQLMAAHIFFNIRTIRLKPKNSGSSPDCIEHRVKIHFENQAHSGLIGYRLSSREHYRFCQESSNNKVVDKFEGRIILYTTLDAFCLCLCLVSLVLCIRSIYRGNRLGHKFTKYFQHTHGRKPSFYARLHFLNFWYIGIIISDVLIIFGSMMKMEVENKWVGFIDYSSCQMLLGIGIGITYVGLLRYIGFFPKYNIIVSVLKNSIPHCARFMLTAGIVYSGYVLCGWLVLGPRNIKFRTIVKTSETLFSLLNGDDMYNTFELTGFPETEASLRIFNQFYLYSFISLFIYVVLSLFLAVILDVYETIKDSRGGKEKFIPDELEKFIGLNVLDSGEPIRLSL